MSFIQTLTKYILPSTVRMLGLHVPCRIRKLNDV